MKKVMIMMAITLIAGMTQAAQIAWTTGTYKCMEMYGSDGTTALGAAPSTGNVVLIMYTSDAYTLAESVILADDSTALVWKVKTGKSNYGTGIQNFSWKVGTGTATTEPVSGSVLGVAWKSNDGKLSRLYKAGTSEEMIINYTVPDTLIDTSTFTYNFANSNFSGTSAAVPEPTSLALLALGIAALGLKRKVR